MYIFKFWKPLLFGVIILVLCLIPSESIAKINFLKISFQDLLAHLVMFFIFSVLLTLDFKKYKISRNKKSHQISIIFTISLLFSLLTEMLQYAFPLLNRSANLGDLIFDLIGTATGTLFVFFTKR